MSPLVWAGLVFAGAAGAAARFGVDRVVTRLFGSRLPFGIMLVNLSGATILGFVVGLALTAPTATVIGTGLIGSYTTFSTWMLQTQGLLSARRPAAAACTVAVSLVFGLLLAWLGIWLGGLL